MKLEEIYSENSEWKDRLAKIREGRVENDDDISEYLNKRTQRDSQVGNRKDKLKADLTSVSVNKIAIPFQKNIVQYAASFLFGEPVTISVSDQDLGGFLNYWENLRMDSLFLLACESAKAFRQSAILFRLEKEDEKEGVKLKANLLKPTKGAMYPIWSTFDELDAFVWETKIKTTDGEKTRIYIYDKTNLEILDETKDGVEPVSKKPHLFDRIPIVYIEEEAVEYEDVKDLIDRFEMRYSKFADTNDYFSQPFFKATGNVDAVPEKDDTGTVYMMDVIELEGGGVLKSDLEVVSWDHAPESTKLEFEIAKGLIYDMSHTPDLSFDNVKGIGNISGVALKMMFLSSLVKRKFSESTYSVAVKRACNILNYGMTVIKAEGFLLEDSGNFSVIFNSVLPTHIQEMISTLTEATMDKAIMSQETAIKMNPLVANADDEYDKIKKENSSELGESQTEF